MRYRLRTLLIVLALGLVSLVSYVLSAGPTHWLYMHGYVNEPPDYVLSVFYWPLD